MSISDIHSLPSKETYYIENPIPTILKNLDPQYDLNDKNLTRDINTYVKFRVEHLRTLPIENKNIDLLNSLVRNDSKAVIRLLEWDSKESKILANQNNENSDEYNAISQALTILTLRYMLYARHFQ